MVADGTDDLADNSGLYKCCRTHTMCVTVRDFRKMQIRIINRLIIVDTCLFIFLLLFFCFVFVRRYRVVSD